MWLEREKTNKHNQHILTAKSSWNYNGGCWTLKVSIINLDEKHFSLHEHSLKNITR